MFRPRGGPANNIPRTRLKARNGCGDAQILKRRIWIRFDQAQLRCDETARPDETKSSNKLRRRICTRNTPRTPITLRTAALA